MDLVLFDLDHTLLNGDTQNEWGRYLAEQGVINLDSYQKKMAYFDEKYHRGKLDIQELLAFQFDILKPYSFKTLNAWLEEYIEKKIRPLIVEAGWKAIAKHRREGAEIILITATNEFLVRPIAQLLGIEHLIASQEERDTEGHFTGGVTGIPSYREGKIKRLQQWLQEQGRSWNDYQSSWFYSDSHNDLPLLSLVDQPMVVNPDATLRSHAEERGWKIIDFGIKQS